MATKDSRTSFLEEPSNLLKLLTTGLHFKIKMNPDDGSLNFDNEISSKEESPWLKSFAELRAQMVQIDQHVYKRIMCQGDVTKGLVPENACVEISYHGYWEYQRTPFDTSDMRGSSYCFNTGRNEVLEGLELAVRSKYQGESAQFVIGYQKLFLEMGCPPRIKPRADALFTISVMTLINVLKLFSDDEFPIVTRKVKAAIAEGNILHTNLAICHNKMKMPKRTLSSCEEVRCLISNNPSCKVIYQEARAYVLLGDYDTALKLIKTAEQMEPSNEAIISECKNIEKKFKNSQKIEKFLFRNIVDIPKESTDNAKNEKSFESGIEEIFADFKNNLTISQITLPSGLTTEEINLEPYFFDIER